MPSSNAALSPIEEQYVISIREWNRTHKIIGAVDPLALYLESREAVLDFYNNKKSPSSCMVDIGAGNGLLGFAWLFAAEHHKVVFVEPDKKKVAFLLNFIAIEAAKISKSTSTSLSTRVKIVPQKIEEVSRETFDQFAGSSGYFLAARAFSGSQSIEGALRAGGHTPCDFWHFFDGSAQENGIKIKMFMLERLLFN